MKVVLNRNYFDFLFAMTEKEIKARYRFAALGFLWIVLNPLLQMLVMGFVFQFFVPIKVDNYFVFLFTGLLPWNFFSTTLLKATPSIVFERSLIQKARFPRESIVLSIVLSHLFHFCIALVLLFVVLVLDKILKGSSGIQLFQYSLRILSVIPLLLWLGVFTSGLSLWFSALNVKYRDVNFVLQAILPLWFYATPILYTLNLLPAQLNRFFYLNPLTAIIELFQFILLNLQPVSFSLAFFSLLISLMVSVSGWYYFRKSSQFFDDWV